ncbi:MAG: hypothetical protein HY717_05300 [Planctomycetes bacterium]|nr:hypothetical protein [Planctomycetota bacterium]
MRRATIFLGFLLSFAPALWVEAGSVFMKNGYIIQGPIVDQDETMIVMGWQNGKVFIYRRFLETVVLDPEEEAAIAKKKAKASHPVEAEPEPALIQSSNPEEDLPPNFEAVVKNLMPEGGKNAARGETSVPVAPFSGAGTSPEAAGSSAAPKETWPGTVAGTEGPPSTPPSVEVGVIPPENKGTGARQEVAELAVSLEPPAGWFRENGGEEGVRWAGTRQEDAFAPSLVIVSAAVNEWNLEDARKALYEDPKEVLADFSIVKEEEKLIQGRRVLQFIGQGEVGMKVSSAEGEKAGSAAKESQHLTVSVRQCLVPGKSRFWLITTFSNENTSNEDLTAMERAVESIQFLAE